LFAATLKKITGEVSDFALYVTKSALNIFAQFRYFVADRSDSLLDILESLFNILSQFCYAVGNRTDSFQHRLKRWLSGRVVWCLIVATHIASLSRNILSRSATNYYTRLIVFKMK
jgi:hypothetical protein